MLWQRNRDGSYSVSGHGPLRPIAVEGETRTIARQAWTDEFGRQYAEQECLTANSASWQMECEAYREI